MSKIKEIKENALIVISNELTEAQYKLTIAEQKLMLALISQIDNSKEHFENIKVNAKSLSDACGFTQKNGYQQLKQVIKKIFNRSIVVKKRNDTGFQIYNWMQFCDYFSCKNEDDIDCSHIEFELDKRLCPHFLQLKNKFLEIGLNHLISFTHMCSIRFYMIFRNLVNNLLKCKKKYTFLEIIKMFQLSSAYQNTTNLKYRIIKTAIDEINEKSDIYVEYEYYREGGRAHVGVIFTFWKKEAVADEIATSNEPASLKLPNKNSSYEEKFQEKEFTDDEQKIYDRLLKNGVLSSAARELVEKYPLDVIERNIKLAMNLKDTIGNMGGFILSAIKQDYMGDTEKEKQKVKERERAEQDALWEKIQSDEKERREKEAQEKAEATKSAKIREQSKLERIGEKKDEMPDFVFDGSAESVEKVIEIYYKNNKKCPDSVLKKIEEQGWNWASFQMEYLELFQKYQARE